MEGSYNVFVAIESGTDFEDFMDHTANTKYVDEWDYWYGEEFGMGDDVLFYQLKVPNRKDVILLDLIGIDMIYRLILFLHNNTV